jgi:predicted Zn-dependent peptidase
MQFEKITLGDGFNLYCLPESKFKVTTLTLMLQRPLNHQAAQNALLSRLLPRGCRKYPNLRKMVIFLESLYGAGLSSAVGKIGECQIIQLHLDFVNERFLPRAAGRNKITQKVLEFLRNILTDPVVEKQGFTQKYFKEEQVNLRHAIEGLMDDKIAYAQQRCIAIMCKDEPFGLLEYGRIEDIDKITPEGLLKYLREIILESPIDIYAVGAIDIVRFGNQVKRVFGRLIALREKYRKQGGMLGVIPDTLSKIKAPNQPNIVKEQLPVDQGKLVMGFRTGISWRDEDIFPLRVFNTLLGGHPNARLFCEVREKAGLAYYASSYLEPSKGLMIVQTGINPENFDKAVAIIKEQLDDIGQGHISESEFKSALNVLQERLTVIEDSANGLIGYFSELFMNSRQESLADLRNKLQQVTPEAVAGIARRIKLDTIYFLIP